jgi:hypothetical protein
MAAQTREQGRYLGGRPPYGYRLADAGPHPNKAHAAWGRRAHRLEPDPVTAPAVSWMFAQRLAGHSAARITRALNDAGVACPSAADPGRNPHRTGAAWTLRTVSAILANPRYTGRQVWNRQRTDFDLADPANTSLGHRQVQRWNLPEGWVISKHPAHAALVSEADFIAAQDAAAPRGPAGPAVRRYLPAGLLACGRCGRRLESAWSNGRPAYRCRHGHTSATRPEPGRPRTPTFGRTRSSRTWPRSASCSPALPGTHPREPQPSSDDGPGQYSCSHRPAARRRRRPHLRPARPDPARRRSRRTVSHHQQGPLTTEPGKEDRLGKARKQHPRRPEAEPG